MTRGEGRNELAGIKCQRVSLLHSAVTFAKPCVCASGSPLRPLPTSGCGPAGPAQAPSGHRTQLPSVSHQPSSSSSGGSSSLSLSAFAFNRPLKDNAVGKRGEGGGNPEGCDSRQLGPRVTPERRNPIRDGFLLPRTETSDPAAAPARRSAAAASALYNHAQDERSRRARTRTRPVLAAAGQEALSLQTYGHAGRESRSPA